MIFNLDLGKFARARVWIGETPAATYACQETLARTLFSPHLRADLRDLYQPTRAVVEVVVPVSTHSMYALIGGQFTPAPGASVEVEFCISDRDVFRFS